MSEPSEMSAPVLLARALEHLEPEERQRVSAWLFPLLAGQGRGTGPLARTRELPLNKWPEMSVSLGHVVAAQSTADAGLLAALAAQSPTGPSLRQGYQTVPVRLPAELHVRLRDWCAEQGFSMATVVRGLVARFLDSRPPAPEKPEEPA